MSKRTDAEIATPLFKKLYGFDFSELVPMNLGTRDGCDHYYHPPTESSYAWCFLRDGGWRKNESDAYFVKQFKEKLTNPTMPIHLFIDAIWVSESYMRECRVMSFSVWMGPTLLPNGTKMVTYLDIHQPGGSITDGNASLATTTADDFIETLKLGEFKLQQRVG